METNKKIWMVKGVVVAVFMILLIAHSTAFSENNKVVCPQFQKVYNNMRMLFSRVREAVMYESPAHTIRETIVVDPAKISYRDSGVELRGGSVSYIVDMDNIPVETLIRSGTDLIIDFEWDRA